MRSPGSDRTDLHHRIRVAEFAKVLENTQRDINIALINEVALISDRLGIDTRDVLEAAGLVHRRREGRYTFHHLDTTPLAPLRERWRRPDERT